jgi:hypothetical protein
MTTKVLAISLLSLFLALTNARGADETRSQEPYRDAFFASLKRLNNTLTAERLPLVTFDFARVRVVVSEDLWVPNMVKVHANPLFSVEFFPQTDHSRLPRIALVYRQIPLSWLGSYDSPPKATWTSEQAIQKCKFWFESVYGEAIANVGTPDAVYEDQPNMPRYRNGQWAVRWPRTDARGHRFLEDNIYCTLDEKYGASFLGRHFVSTFVECQKMLITADEAIAISRPAATTLLSARIASEWSGGLTLKSEAKAEVRIVNPNHILKYLTSEEVPWPGDVLARLAWVIKLRASDAKTRNVYIYLWIDTETKEVLGGEFSEK